MEDMNKRNQEPEEESQGGGTSRQSQTTEDFECLGCGSMFKRKIIKLQGMDFSRKFCDECVKKHEEEDVVKERATIERDISARRQCWRDKSGMPLILNTKTFDNYYEGGKKVITKKVREWAEKFVVEKPHGTSSLILYSDKPGLGKTHLMASVVNYIVDNWCGDPYKVPACPMLFESGPGLVRRIRSTYNLPAESTHEREEDVYNQLNGVRLLLLDDVGKERPSDFTRETYWYIIDERLKNELPVVISSRLDMGALEELMGEDTVDRLYGMTRGEILEIKGSSYRRRNLQP